MIKEVSVTDNRIIKIYTYLKNYNIMKIVLLKNIKNTYLKSEECNFHF